MALVDWSDFERQTKSTLSDPDGRNLAATVANVVLARSAKFCNRLTWEYGTQAKYFSPDCAQNLLWPKSPSARRYAARS